MAGEVFLDGRPIGSYRSKAAARRLAMLPQSPIAPESISVQDLVRRGRYPHQSLLRQWTADDAAAVHEALTMTDAAHLAARQVSELSGGQRQRVWIAMVLAQQTEFLLPDEPTTFSTSLTNRRRLISAPTCTGPAGPSSPCCTISIRPRATPLTWSV